MEKKQEHAYKYRIAFGAWLNDMRNEPLPLQNWPAPQLDDEAVNSAIRALNVQSEAGFNTLDTFGLYATYGYPLDILSAFTDKERRRQVDKLFKAANERGIEIMFGLGLFTWGYDTIIKEDPEVRGVDEAGNPHPHAMCGAKEKSWRYVEKILDTVLSEFDFGGVHLESADQGWCSCPECAGKYGVVGYNARLNIRAANYIKSKWPNKMVMSIPINWISSALSESGDPPSFNDEEKAHVIDLSKHIDCFMDQGHRGTFIPDRDRKKFIQKLHCDYGTSGGMWLYHSVRWSRSSYFLPYPQRAAEAIKRHYDDGVRDCLFYQGPMNNPAVEVNTAVGGRILSDTTRSIEDALSEVIEVYYKPKSADAHKKLVEIFQRAEAAYFGQWDAKRFAEIHSSLPPGEFKLNDALFGKSPGPATYLMEPYLDADGRAEYKKGLVAILRDLATIKNNFEDNGRLKRINSAIIITLNFVNTICYCKGETWQD